jgi:hypothetical protein
MIKAAQIDNVIRKGSSVPIIAADENDNYFFVKVKAAGDGLTSLIADWIVTSIGNKIGLPILKPEIIIIDEATKINYKHPEISDLVRRSYGYNLAYKYFPDAQLYNVTKPHPDFKKDEKDLIFLFDSFFVNIDRTKDNPNVFNSKNNIYAVDFGACFLIKEIFDNIPYCLNPEIQKLLKRNIFYSEDVSAEMLLERFGTLSKDDLNEIINGFPDEWIAGSKMQKKELSSKLYLLMNENNHLTKALDTLKNIQVPTDEELKRNREANKRKFEDGIFKNVVPLMPESKRF